MDSSEHWAKTYFWIWIILAIVIIGCVLYLMRKRTGQMFKRLSNKLPIKKNQKSKRSKEVDEVDEVVND